MHNSGHLKDIFLQFSSFHNFPFCGQRIPRFAARVLSAIFAFRPCPVCVPKTRSQEAGDLVTF